nr:hypothetical protein [Candidatus Anoxychlamydiales bacterium]
MSQLVEKAYKYRFYPTKFQKEILEKTFGCSRKVYNHFLDLRSKTYKDEKKSINYNDTSKILTTLKIKYPWLKEVSSVCLQQSLRHLDRAFSSFFKKKSKYPKFKKKRNRQSAKYMKTSFIYEDDKITLAKMKEPLNVRWSRKFKSSPTSLTITKETDDTYYISIIVKEEIKSLDFKKKKIGIDLGIIDTITDSEGNNIKNPKFLNKALKKLKQRQKSLSRKLKKSQNRIKARKKLAKLHQYIKNKRLDFLHKLSWQLVNENQVIAAERLNIKNMLKNRHLAKSISDVSWKQLITFLEYKSKWYKRIFFQVDPFFPSSKTCNSCGHKLSKLPLSIRKWNCPNCNIVNNRDENAAKNVLDEAIKEIKEEYRGTLGNVSLWSL